MLTAHTLGSLDLLNDYFVVHEGDQGWNPNFKITISDLHGSDGARLAYARVGATPRVLYVICEADDYNASRALADAIDAVLIQARNFPRTGTLVTYAELDESELVADTWKVLGGIYRRTNALRPASIIDGPVNLWLSKV